MSAPFTPEQEVHILKMIVAALRGVERERLEQRFSQIEAAISFGITSYWDLPSEAPDQAQHRAAEGGS